MSGPWLDRMDNYIEVHHVGYDKLSGDPLE